MWWWLMIWQDRNIKLLKSQPLVISVIRNHLQHKCLSNIPEWCLIFDTCFFSFVVLFFWCFMHETLTFSSPSDNVFIFLNEYPIKHKWHSRKKRSVSLVTEFVRFSFFLVSLFILFLFFLFHFFFLFDLYFTYLINFFFHFLLIQVQMYGLIFKRYMWYVVHFTDISLLFSIHWIHSSVWEMKQNQTYCIFRI